jgi:hypothetical protein
LGTIVERISKFEQESLLRVYILIHWYDHDQEPDAKAREPTASPKVIQILCTGLEAPTKEVDHASNNDGYE